MEKLGKVVEFFLRRKAASLEIGIQHYGHRAGGSLLVTGRIRSGDLCHVSAIVFSKVTAALEPAVPGPSTRTRGSATISYRSSIVCKELTIAVVIPSPRETFVTVAVLVAIVCLEKQPVRLAWCLWRQDFVEQTFISKHIFIA